MEQKMSLAEIREEQFKQSTLCDSAHRQAALDILHSFIVQAPAGSGKTTLLTERVLALLAGGVANPEECLCITFTQKAAAEMRERVLIALEHANQSLGPVRNSETNSSSSISTEKKAKELSTEALARKVLERDALLGWDLLNNPNRLRIQTIDSLCAELAQKMPLHSGLGSAMKITETPQIFYEEAARSVLESLESKEPWTDALYILLGHLDNDWEALVHLLAEMLSHRDQWLLSLGPTFFKQPNKAQLEQGLQTTIIETLKCAKSVIPEECSEELLMLARFAASQLKVLSNSNALLAESKILHCFECQEWPADTLQALPIWQGIAELLLTEANQLRKTVTERQGFPSQQSTKDREEKTFFKNMKESMQACLIKLNEFPDFCSALQSIRECPPAHYTESQWKVVQALLTTLPMLVAELMLSFQKQGQVDFIEIALAAHQALGDNDTPTDMALKFGYKTRHILVDEFQDTSLSQFFLLEKLTLTWSEHEGNTLFLVGDPMQSIYRFRRADVGLFIQAKQAGVNDFTLKSLKLSANFRSHPCIVDWVNKHFSELFPKHDDMLSGAICYTPFQSGAIHLKTETEHALEVNLDSEVIIHAVDEETEAEKIVACIESVKRNNVSESIALLVRSRSHLKYIIPALENKRIPYQGVELQKLNSRQRIQDLLSLLRALIHLGDKIAWLALLKSPYCGLSLSDLEILATFKESLPLFWSLKQYETIQELTMDAKARCKILVPILEEALFERERLPVATWIRNTWHKLQTMFMDVPFLNNNPSNQNNPYNQHNASNQNNQNNQSNHNVSANTLEAEETETFFAILRETAKNEDIFTLGLLEQKINDHYAASNVKNPHALQIMTIHKAKGLEFDTVLLAGLGRRERSDSSRLLLWEERRSEFGKPYLLLAPIRSAEIKKDPIYEYLRKQEQKRAQYENLRLLYVAATRAKKRLYGFTHNEALLDSEAVSQIALDSD